MTDQRTAWQPISTAPKDGTPVVVYAERGRRGKRRRAGVTFASVARWAGGWGWLSVPTDIQLHPTHWVPLPAPPVTKEPPHD
jgi:hypothetical protein